MEYLRYFAGLMMAVMSVHSFVTLFVPRWRIPAERRASICLIRGIGFAGMAWMMIANTFLEAIAIGILTLGAVELLIRLVQWRSEKTLATPIQNH
jgi:hypothetical protein